MRAVLLITRVLAYASDPAGTILWQSISLIRDIEPWNKRVEFILREKGQYFIAAFMQKILIQKKY